MLLACTLAACAPQTPPSMAGEYPQTVVPVVPVSDSTPTASRAHAKTVTRFLQDNGVNVIKLGDTVEIVIPADKIFLPNSMQVKYSGEPLLFAVVDLINSYGTPPLNVVGHTDLIGTTPYKQDLSELWAQSVSTYLWAHGIALDRIHMGGVADSQDIASRRTAQGSYYNRRVEISFWARRVKNAKVVRYTRAD